MSETATRKKDISRFLELCVIYSDDSLARKQRRLDELDAEGRTDLAAEMTKWRTFREFCDYTIEELAEGKLDEWLERLHDLDFHPAPDE